MIAAAATALTIGGQAPGQTVVVAPEQNTVIRDCGVKGKVRPY